MDIPEIPEGFATQLGKAGTALLAIVAVITPFLEGNDLGDAKFFAALSTGVAIVTIFGRMLQSAALLRDAPSPAQTFDEPDLDVDLPDVGGSTHVPSEHDLATEFPGEQPTGMGKAGERT